MAIVLLAATFTILLGVALIAWPSSAIEFQRRFYEKINWRMEPISMSKEIRNTRIMGGMLIVAAVIAIVYSVVNR